MVSIDTTTVDVRRPWGAIAALAFLALCLVGGLVLGQWLAPKPIIGVVRFEAPIDFYTAAQLMEVIEEARTDDQVAGVVLEILSPGGFATSSESLFYSLLQLREEKPVVAAIDGLAASGGYYMAAAANRIYAPASAYVGNVGTRGARPLDPALSPMELSSGPYKLSGGNRFDRIRQLDLVKDAFVNNVVYQRQNAAFNPLNVSAETVAEARIYLGSEAVAIGLIDKEGGTGDAVVAAAELGGVSEYDSVDLLERYGISILPPAPVFQEVGAQGAAAEENYMKRAVHRLVEQAPPDTIFLLDDRYTLPDVGGNSALERHLLRLRQGDPAGEPGADSTSSVPGGTLSQLFFGAAHSFALQSGAPQ